MKTSNPILEFIGAAKKTYSYNVFENIYIWFGFLWGLPVPLVTIFFEMHVLEAAGINQGFVTTLASPIQWFFLAHPLLFGILFGILGTVRYDKDSELNSTITQLNDLAVHDNLTGLKNRRYFVHIFHDECARSQRRREPLSLLFLDIDFFKRINDTHGHHLGDLVLKELAAYLKSECRPYDTPVRWGGEEFLILLRATDEAAAVLFAERIREGIEYGLDFPMSIQVTVSIGLAQYRQNDTLETLTERSDQALYHAKQAGRNRTVSWKMLLESRENSRSRK